MKTKKLLAALLLGTAVTTQAQITPSLSIPAEIPNYDGTYDAFGQGELYYPNGGEVRFDDDSLSSAVDVVKYYTMYTHPRRFLLANNNISMVYDKCEPAGSPDTLHRIDLEWKNSAVTASLARVDTQNIAVLNYFTQWFGSSGRTGVRGGAAIACQSIYNNIDLVYTSNTAGLVIYFIVYPGGNYKDIILSINGAKSNAIVGNKLRFDANWDYTTLEKPQMYQYTISGNTVTPVTVCNASWQSLGGDDYQLLNSTSYNTALPLIIQIKQGNAPPYDEFGLHWSTYFGGTGADCFTRTHSDASNNLFTAGQSNSTGLFPQFPGLSHPVANYYDAAISKFDPAGILQMSTFVGGSATEEFYDFDFQGNSIFCVGKTESSDLITVPKTGATTQTVFGGGGWDGFICELIPIQNVGMQLNWLTYFGGSGMDELNACKFDAANNLFVVGASSSTNMSISGPSGSYQQSFNAAQMSTAIPLSTDAIIAKFNTSSAQTWFTFYGSDALGTNAYTDASDYFYGLTVNGTDVYACGKAGGSNLPNSSNTKQNNGNFDGILTHFTTGGAMGPGDAKFTDGNIVNYGVKVLWDKVYTVGQADSVMTPVNSGYYYYCGADSGYTDACFSVHPLGLDSTFHNSFLGGDGVDVAHDIQFNSNNLFYISGGTASRNFPTNNLNTTFFSNAVPDLTGLYTNDNFVSCFQPGNTSLIWSTYLGSKNAFEYTEASSTIQSGSPRSMATIAVDGLNRLHLAGTTPSYTTFPRDNGAGIPYFQALNNMAAASSDGTITRFDVSDINAIVGLDDFKDTQFVFGIYPNPTADKILITNKALTNNDLRYAIYDLGGKKLQEGKLKAGNEKAVDVLLLPQGVYIINVSNGKTTYSNKFVKMNN